MVGQASNRTGQGSSNVQVTAFEPPPPPPGRIHATLVSIGWLQASEQYGNGSEKGS